MREWMKRRVRNWQKGAEKGTVGRVWLAALFRTGPVDW